MAKRKGYEDDSSNEDSPNSLDGVDYTDQRWPARGGNDWRSFKWAFGLGPSSSSSSQVGRRRGRRAARGAATPNGGSVGEETDPMKELLEIVLWGAGESEIDITADLEEELDSDDEELECIKRAMAREQTIRPSGAVGVARGAQIGGEKKESGGGGGGGEGKGAKASNGLLSVSNLRFDSLLKIGTTAQSSKKKSILRLEQRTTTMDRAFKGDLEDVYISESSRRQQKGAEPASKMTTPVVAAAAAAGDEENFWDDVEF